jgi:hypothetical protein
MLPTLVEVLNRRLVGLRLRVGDSYWVVTAASIAENGMLQVHLMGDTKTSVLVDMPPGFDSTCVEDMAWLVASVESRLTERMEQARQTTARRRRGR